MPKRLLFIIVIISIVLFFLPQRFKLFLARPPQLVLLSPVNYINSALTLLRIKNQELIKLNQLVTELTLENLQLKEKLNWIQETSFTLSSKSVPAKIIGRDPETLIRYLVINKGTLDQIQKDLVVVSPSGLVGKILDVGPLYSIVETPLSPKLKISAVNSRNNTIGIIEAGDRQLLRFKYSSSESDLAMGDTIITSGIGGIFPRGIKIGFVTKVKPEPTGFFQHVVVRPLTNFYTLEYVVVLLEKYPTERIKVSQPRTNKLQEIFIEIPLKPRIR
jgi:rod shape-determining protein MreC